MQGENTHDQNNDILLKGSMKSPQLGLVYPGILINEWLFSIM